MARNIQNVSNRVSRGRGAEASEIGGVEVEAN